MSSWRLWIPGGLLSAGCLLNGALLGRKVVPVELRTPIDSVAPVALGITGEASRFSPDVERVAGMTTYINRWYRGADRPMFNIYVGYYDEQRQGHTIHSPKNCLPGGGWEPVEDAPVTFPSSLGPVTVNRYLLSRPGESALVYYWYQGRGRVAHNEFTVKFELLRDAVTKGRTEESLVRIFVPIVNNQVEPADRVARDLVGPLVSDVDRVLPKFP